MVTIGPGLEIPDGELRFRTTRSSGPGGQHVNTSDTRVVLLFDVDRSPSLSPDQKQLLHDKLGGRISKAGVLRLSSQRHRSQFRNRQAVVERFVRLMESAVEPDTPRVQTTIPEREKRRRLLQKRRQAEKKRRRSQQVEWED